ncbi:MAG TPA: site-2 protease family protein, partial [Candidatus Paceibacterota bacterium]|nr:site-2 protease family protein [Candidatus Paceibacterota bacterium]
LMALLFSIIIRGAMYFGLPIISDSLALSPFYQITSIIVITNLVLAFFNLIPIPPLDGSKVLFSLLPARFFNFKVFLSRYGFFILIFFILFIWKLVAPFIMFLFSLLTGLAI